MPPSLTQIEGVEVSDSVFSDRPALWVNGTEIAHRDADGAVDVRLTREVIRRMRARLRDDPRVRLRSSSSDWIEVRAEASDDEALLVELVELAAQAHRSPPGTTPRPPPVGTELARRRRFH